MKKNFIILLGLGILSLCGVRTTQAYNPKALSHVQEMKDNPHGYDIIELQGSLLLSAGPNAIVAGYNENSVYLQFNQNFGYVDVTFYNPNGLIVYSNVVNTAVQQLVVIPITGFIDGIYTIVLENAYGYAEGDFEQNND